MHFQTFALLDTLKHVEIAGYKQCGSLEILHLRWPAGDGLTYSTLGEALEAHWIEVPESTEAGQVSRIKIINRSAQMVPHGGRTTHRAQSQRIFLRCLIVIVGAIRLYPCCLK